MQMTLKERGSTVGVPFLDGKFSDTKKTTGHFLLINSEMRISDM